MIVAGAPGQGDDLRQIIQLRPEGKFEMKYSDGSKELIAGKYTVIITKSKSNRDKGQESAGKVWTELLPTDVAHFAQFNNTDEVFPAIYNSDSILEYDVKASASIVQPKFEISSIDPELSD